MRANAVVFTGPNEVRHQQVDCPEPGADDVVVRVTHSWISNGTEGSFLRGERIGGDTPRRETDPWPFPIVAGYQKIGIVEWVGGDVADVEIGETVFSASGKVNGMFSPRGGQISPSITSRDHLWKLPDHPEPSAYAGLVLTQVGYNCGTRARMEAGDWAVVIGDGMVGQWASQTLARQGATVVLVGHHADRLNRFTDGHCVDASATDWVDEVGKLCSSGVAVVVDTVGSIPAVEAVIPLMRRQGHIVSAGFYGTEDLLALQPLRDSELSVDMVSGWTRPRMDATRDMIRDGALQTLPLMTHRFPVDRAADAWKLISHKDDDVLGVILEWPH